jgi:5-methylcytosine-specific restriction endonuclease McrA
MNSKVCNECGIDKPLSEYFKAVTCKDGYRGKCKDCYRLITKAYRQTDKGREVRKENRRKYDKTPCGKAALRRHNQRYRQTPHGKEANLRYFRSEKGKETYKRKNYKRRSKVQDAGTFTNEQWQERLAEYNYCCAYCYKPFPVNELTVDHMQPISRGGTNTIDNLVPACKSCNSRKNTNTPLEMLQKGLM